MKPEEIKTFLDANSGLFQHFYTNASQSELELAIGIDDVSKLLHRLFESKEFKQKFVKLTEIIKFPTAPDPNFFCNDQN